MTPYHCSLPIGGVSNVNVQGPEACFNNTTYLLDSSHVFGMSLAAVRNIADYVGSSLTTPPVTLTIAGDDGLSYFDGSVTFGATHAKPYDSLTGYGVLVVNGDLTFEEGNMTQKIPASSYNGVIFVTGNFIVGPGCSVNGAVILGEPAYHHVGGVGSAEIPPTLTLQKDSSNGLYGSVYYDPNSVQRAMDRVGQYREDISERKVLLAIPNL